MLKITGFVPITIKNKSPSFELNRIWFLRFSGHQLLGHFFKSRQNVVVSSPLIPMKSAIETSGNDTQISRKYVSFRPLFPTFWPTVHAVF